MTTDKRCARTVPLRILFWRLVHLGLERLWHWVYRRWLADYDREREEEYLRTLRQTPDLYHCSFYDYDNFDPLSPVRVSLPDDDAPIQTPPMF